MINKLYIYEMNEDEIKSLYLYCYDKNNEIIYKYKFDPVYIYQISNSNKEKLNNIKEKLIEEIKQEFDCKEINNTLIELNHEYNGTTIKDFCHKFNKKIRKI